MKTITKITLLLVTLSLTLSVAYAETGFQDTNGVAEDFNELWIDAKKVANITEYNNTDCIDQVILAGDDQPVIKHVTKDSVEEVSSADQADSEVYEYLTDTGMYYSFSKDKKIYIVTIDAAEWDVGMLDEMDEWCLENSN